MNWKVFVDNSYRPGFTFIVEHSYHTQYNKSLITTSINDFQGKTIANLLGLSLNTLQNYLIDNYNTHKNKDNIIYFKTKEDAEKALEWIEAGITARILANDI